MNNSIDTEAMGSISHVAAASLDGHIGVWKYSDMIQGKVDAEWTVLVSEEFRSFKYQALNTHALLLLVHFSQHWGSTATQSNDDNDTTRRHYPFPLCRPHIVVNKNMRTTNTTGSSVCRAFLLPEKGPRPPRPSDQPPPSPQQAVSRASCARSEGGPQLSASAGSSADGTRRAAGAS